MDEHEALDLIANGLGEEVGDDCAVVPFGGTKAVLTTDMLHEKTDFPDGITDYVIGWRSVAVSLSDVASMGACPVAVVLAYGAPEFEDSVEDFVSGAREASEKYGTEYVGGDLDRHDEPTVVSTALGKTDDPVGRDGAETGEVVAVTGELGQTAVGLTESESGNTERTNDLFAFEPRVSEGLALAPHATAMTDLSDGIAVGLHNLADASEVGFEINRDEIPTVEGASQNDIFVGEDYELLFTLPRKAIEEAHEAVPEAGKGITVLGKAVEKERGITMDDEPLGMRGYEH